MHIDTEYPFFDCFGFPLAAGDVVSYPAKRGEAIDMRLAQIIKITQQPDETHQRWHPAGHCHVTIPVWRAVVQPLDENEAPCGKAVALHRVDNLVKRHPTLPVATLSPIRAPQVEVLDLDDWVIVAIDGDIVSSDHRVDWEYVARGLSPTAQFTIVYPEDHSLCGHESYNEIRHFFREAENAR
jgi:hypothetical protein